MKGSLFVNGLTIDWNKVDPDSYLHRIKALSGMESLSFEAPVTFFVGENGTGKSTLLESRRREPGFPLFHQRNPFLPV